VNCTAVQNDGPSASLTAPNGQAQRRLISTTSFSERDHVVALEAHGTGTALGDPIEVGAAIEVLCQKEGTTVLCTSLKANMGHLEAVAAGAGISSLISTPL